MEIERIEDWRGQQVVDKDGEKIGRLDDVYRPVGGGEPGFASVKTGLTGRSLTLVPLHGASATRDHIRLGVAKALVDDGPRAAGTDELTGADEETLVAHYDLPDPEDREGGEGARYESQALTEARVAEAGENLKEAERLEAEAADHDRRAGAAREAAAEDAQTEQDAASQRDANLEEAARLREEAGEGRSGGR